MSWVTNTILYFDCLSSEHEKQALAKVNAYFTEGPGHGHGFVSIADERLPKYWYGGGKALECSLAIGAFNHLDIDALVHHLCTLAYNNHLNPLETQLILMDQEDEKFRLINIDVEMRKRGMVPTWMEPLNDANDDSA